MNKKSTVIILAIAVVTAACLSGCGNKLTFVEAVEPTCTESGHSQYYTDKYGNYYNDAEGKEEISADSVLIAALGHNYEAPVFSWNNDYSGASATFTCARDGLHTHTEAAVVTSDVTEATCADGKTVYTATVTFEGEDYTDEKEQVISATQEHSAATDYKSDETNHWYECSVCHTNVGLEKHNFVWKTDKEATETQSGLRHEECTVCEYKRNENTEIPSTSGLVHYPAKDSTCTEQGNIEYWELDGKYYSDEAHTQEITLQSTKKPLAEHTPESGWQKDDAKHWHNCSVCGNTAGEKQNHSFKWVTDKEATETQAGLKHEECTDCEYTRNENTEIPATATLVHHDAQDSTCAVRGNIEYWEIGGKYYRDEACTDEITLEQTLKELAAHTPQSEWQSGNGKHWHNCSVCGGYADEKQDHSYTDEVTAPTCTEQGYTTHSCECGESYKDGETPALGHNYISVYESGEDGANGTFYKVCKNDETDKTAIIVYGDRNVTVNGKGYNPYTCYSTENSFVTYDAIEQLFVIHLNGVNFADGLNITGGNNEVALSVDEDTTISSLTFTKGFNDIPLYIRGYHKLTITGDFSSEQLPVVVNTDLTINGNVNNRASSFTVNSGKVIVKGTLSASLTLLGGTTSVYKLLAKDLTVGDASGVTKPVLNIKGAGITNENISWVGTLAINYQILSGTVNIQKSGEVWTGIDIKGENSGSIITVGQHATLNIKGFNHGIAYQTKDGKLEIAGNVNIIASENCTNNVNIKVNNGGILTVLAEQWGITGGSVELVSGKATLIKNGFGYAAFNSISSLSVSEGFDLGIKNFNQIVHGTVFTEETLKVNAIITTELNGGEAQNELLDGKYAAGTVTPATLEIDDIPDAE